MSWPVRLRVNAKTGCIRNERLHLSYIPSFSPSPVRRATAPPYLPGNSCRTRRRSDTRLPSSLSRVTPSAVSEHLPELLGCPIPAPSLRIASVPNQGLFPPPALPGFNGNTGLSVTPLRPDPSLTGVRLPILEHALGLPVLRAFSFVYMPRHYPAQRLSSYLLNPPAVSTFPERVTGSVCASIIFEACSAFTRVAACTLALPPIRDMHFPKTSTVSLPPQLLR